MGRDAAGHWNARDSALAALLGAAAALLYAPALGFEFIAFDDRRCVAANPWLLDGLSLAALRWSLTAFFCSNWHPLTWLSYLLDAELFGIDPRGFHATNIALHAVATALVYRVLRRATGRRLASAIVAAFFACHPLHVEVVAWVAQRKELLAMCCGLLAVDLYVSWTRAGGRARYAGVVAATALALMAKPTWVSLPLLLWLFDLWPLARISDRRTFVSAALEKLPLAALSLASCAITLAAQAGALETAAAVGAFGRLANAIASVARYLELTLWPVGLSILHPHPYLPGGAPLSPARIVWSLGLVLAISALVWRARERRHLVVGWLWFLVALLPVIGILQVGQQAFAERYTYLPHLGLFTAVAFELDRARKARKARFSRPTCAALAALCVAWTALAAQRIDAWRDTITLYERSLEATPRSPWLLFNLGNQHFERGDHAQAIARFEAALAVWPDMPSARASLAWTLATTPEGALRDGPRALALARELVEQDGFRDANLLDTLAAALAATGDFAAAEPAAARAAETARRARQTDLAAQIEARRRGYREGRAYRARPE